MTGKDLKRFPLDLISSYRNAIYGFAITWIALFHAHAINSVDYSFGYHSLRFFRTFMETGNVGVEIFLFASGISLYFAYSKKPETYIFLIKRLLRLWIPVVVVDGVYWLVRFWIIGGTPARFINRILMVEFWETGDQSIWFVSLIAVLYILYPLMHGFVFRRDNDKSVLLRGGALMIICYLAIISFASEAAYFDTIEIAVTRIPSFVFGVIAGKFVFEHRKIPMVFAPAAFIVAAAFFAVIHKELLDGYEKRLFYIIGGVSLSYVLAIIFKLIDSAPVPGLSSITRAFNWIGGFSLELYLAQGMLNQIYRSTDFYIVGNLPRFLVMIAAAYIMAWAASKVVGIVQKNCPIIKEVYRR